MKFEQLSRSERIGRIGELLAKGVALLALADQQQAALAVDSNLGDDRRAKGGNGGDNPRPELQNEEEQKIFAYVERMTSASPRELQQHLGLSKATAYRRLNRLVEAKLLVRSGATKGIKYQLNRNGASKRQNAPAPGHKQAPALGI